LLGVASYVRLKNGASLAGGKVLLQSAYYNVPIPQPFVEIVSGYVGISGESDSVTIEMWVDIDIKTSSDAVLFSFGDPSLPGYLSLSAKGLQGKSNAYISVVVDSFGMDVYVNGSSINSDLSRFMSWTSQPLFGGMGDSLPMCYLGWDKQATTPGLIGSIDELRIWQGRRSKVDIQSTASQGLDTSKLHLTSTDTSQPIFVSIVTSTTIRLTIQFFGGLSNITMFGGETSFLVESLNPSIGFTAVVALNSSTSTAVLNGIPATDYRVSLLPYNTSVSMPTALGVNCAPSLDPYSYLKQSNQLSQLVYVNLLETKTPTVTFRYRSGICMTITIPGSQSISTILPTTQGSSGQVCFSNDPVILRTGDQLPVTISAFELYLSQTSWFSSPTSVLTASVFTQAVVTDVSVQITDLVSGFNSVQTFDYQGSSGLGYVIEAGSPLVSYPFVPRIQISAIRSDPRSLSIATYTGYIPVLGSIPSEVPNLYPISTDPTLIFLVLRDPPGGASKTTIHAGTSFTTTVSIEGMQTLEQGNLMTSFASSTAFGPTVSSSRKSSSHFEYSFNFGYDFSTSVDPFIAGHASDVIIGGGVDIIVSQALEGTFSHLRIHCLF
jgi:hypothetical protein